MISPSCCPPWPYDLPGQTCRTARRLRRCDTTPQDTIRRVAIRIACKRPVTPPHRLPVTQIRGIWKTLVQHATINAGEAIVNAVKNATPGCESAQPIGRAVWRESVGQDG